MMRKWTIQSGIKIMKQEFLVLSSERQVCTIYKASRTLMAIGMQATYHLISACSLTKLPVVLVIQKVLQLRKKALVHVYN